MAALFLARQHLDRPRARRLTARSLTRLASDTGGVQIDSINVVDRAHYLTVWSRFGNYDRRALDRLVYQRRVLFEYWAHAACLVPAAHFPWWRRAMLDYCGQRRPSRRREPAKGRPLRGAFCWQVVVSRDGPRRIGAPDFPGGHCFGSTVEKPQINVKYRSLCSLDTV